MIPIEEPGISPRSAEDIKRLLDLAGPSLPKMKVSRDGATVREAQAAIFREVYQSLEKISVRPHTPSMTDNPRRNNDSNLKAIEERMDKRIERMEKTISDSVAGYRHEIAYRDEGVRREIEAKHQVLESYIKSNSEMVGRIEKDFEEVISSNKALKLWLAGIGAAVILGIGGMNATIFSGGKAFFDGGVNHSEVRALLQDARAQSEANRLILEELRARPEGNNTADPAKPTATSSVTE